MIKILRELTFYHVGRFGKSLTLSTLKEIFLGNKELFKDFGFIILQYKWKKHPVIRFDFSKQKTNEPEVLKGFINNQLDYIAEEYSVQLTRRNTLNDSKN